jgi:pSer/pThr/pTyr-binding forkhead associated (FHA) protein
LRSGVRRGDYSQLHFFEETEMFSRITLTATQGQVKGHEFVLEKRGRYVIGRAEDCDLCLTGEVPGVSRHHCVLRVEGPTVSIRDLGSCNGTFVNTDLIGRRSWADQPEDAAFEENFTDYELHDGDMLRLGKIIFRVGIHEPSEVHDPEYFPAGYFLNQAPADR